jgi:hypothetical protein
MRPAAGKSLSAMRELQTPVGGFRSPFGALSGTGTSAFTEFSVRPYFVLNTLKNKYLTSGPERSDNLSELMTSVATGNATVIDKDGVLKNRFQSLFMDGATGTTQSIAVVSGIAYTISFKGTGLITYSGAAAGTLSGTGESDRVRVAVTAGTTTLTCTVAGAITKVTVYRSDLGGMQMSSKDGSEYLEATGSPHYALRRDYTRDTVNGEILGEPAGVNLVPNSDLSAGWESSGATITPNNAVSLSGQTDAATVDLTTTSTSFVYQACTVAASTLYTASWDGKPGTATAWVAAFFDQTNAAWIDRAAYTLTAAVPLANGWYRYSVQVTTPSGCTSMRVYPARNDDGSGAVAGTQGTTDFAFVQLEAYHIDTSRIPTYGAAEARAKDEASTVIADKIPGFIQGSGTLVFEGSIDYEAGGSGFPRIFQIDDGGALERFSILGAESSGVVGISARTTAASQGSIYFLVSSGAAVKAAMRYGEDDYALSINGAATVTDSSGSVPSALTTVRLGDIGGVLTPIRISHFSIGPYASPVSTPGWSNAQLAVISGA